MANNIRRFDFTKPITYKGYQYPSTQMSIEDDNGNTKNTNVFADSTGQYYTLNSQGKAVPIILNKHLDEVVVTPSPKSLSEGYRDFLTQSNDNTQVLNTPHREYNSNLEYNTLRGAQSHSLWEKEHPNLASWSYAASALPWVVAAYPFMAATGETAAGTALGQTTLNTAEAVFNTPLMQMIDYGIGAGSIATGLSDIVVKREFTPQTALDLAVGIPLYLKTIENVKRGLNRNNGSLREYLTESNIPTELKKEGTKRYTDFIESPEYRDRLKNAGLESHWQDMKDLTNERLNNIGYFPGRKQRILDNNPRTQGLSHPTDGISLKKGLHPKKEKAVLDHEIAHWATKNTGVEDKGFLGDIMTYNESIVPNTPWEDVLRKAIQDKPHMTVDEATELEEYYTYLIDPQEKRARAMSIYQQAKESNHTVDEFIDMWTSPNGEIYNFAPAQLRELSIVLSPSNLKKYLNKVLGITAPIGAGATLMYIQNK